ncbi:PorT family protein [Flavobacterium zhairuonense]|uniref:porin family protein n=1 Tax=Flavobacterium zhairuonense TaxID=2493631 RepID=UPI00104F12EE|nr:porin family protein [Flavobacterium zhairuonense]KAF2513699.1 PorT family protein [Flavobacterium zhairuonense]
MKKIILSAVAVMAFGFANAQDVKFGVKGGLNFANLGGDLDGDGVTSFHVGALAEIKLSDKFAVQPEVLFSGQGADFSEDGFDSTLKFSYLNIPVMAKYYVIEKLSIEAGPQIGFLLSAKNEDEDVKDSFKSVDFGVNFGAGYDFTEHFFAGVRYNVGLSNIADVPDEADFKTNNGVFSVSVGYKF